MHVAFADVPKIHARFGMFSVVPFGNQCKSTCDNVDCAIATNVNCRNSNCMYCIQMRNTFLLGYVANMAWHGANGYSGGGGGCWGERNDVHVNQLTIVVAILLIVTATATVVVDFELTRSTPHFRVAVKCAIESK